MNNSQQRKYVHAMHAWYDPRAQQTIQSLAELAEARRQGEKEGPGFIVILDDLNFVEDLSVESQVDLRWLLAYGAQSNIWLVATIKAGYTPRFRFWLEAFRTRIIGCVRGKQDLANVSLIPGFQMKSLAPSEFRVWTGADWLTYQLPLLGT